MIGIGIELSGNGARSNKPFYSALYGYLIQQTNIRVINGKALICIRCVHKKSFAF